MDPNDLIKADPRINNNTAEIIAAVPLADIVERICGPSDPLGQRLKERVEQCFEKATSMIQDAGFEPQTVPLKLLLPILRGASLEDDEDLHTMWAALLANAASLENAKNVRPGFIATLRSMAPDEVGLLKWICAYEKAHTHIPTDLNVLARGLHEVTGAEIKPESPHLRACLCRLDAERLIASMGQIYYSVPLASAFLAACCPPKPKS